MPEARRVELLAQIREHITVTLSGAQDQGEATVRTILDRLGEPEDIAREAGAGSAPAGEEVAGRLSVGALELVTVVLLLIGGIVLPVLGWLAGVVLLWASARWTSRDKLIGTLVFPGGLAVAAWYLLFWGGSSVCTSDGACQTSGMSAGPALTLALVGSIGSIGSAAYLLHRARRTAA
ncbi:HAAS signaling domain-containing protein [Actinoallomurus iriomotensis]|uniref:HAAS signaling domain-containing protein n=1 Tax=Actinoallomurus iriomotensis TaxID=478107 RepID=UPI003D7F54CB